MTHIKTALQCLLLSVLIGGVFVYDWFSDDQESPRFVAFVDRTGE